MAQMYTIEAFEPPQVGQNSYQGGRTEYTYWVKFQEFEEQVMVVKLKPSLQIGQQLFGEVIGKTSKKGNLYYRFSGAKQGQGPATQPQTANVPTPRQNVTTASQNVSYTLSNDLDLKKWAIEQAIECIKAGQGSYPDLFEIAKDIYTAVDKVEKLPPTTTEIAEVADLPNDHPVKAVYSTPPVDAVAPMPDEMPANFLGDEDDTV